MSEETLPEDWPTPRARFVYDEHVKRFGDPDRGFVFDDQSAVHPTREGWPKQIDVFAWLPDDQVDLTTFTTIGMSEGSLSGVEHRAELHFAIRRELDEDELVACGAFLANLSMYPFHHATHFDWWHRVRQPGTVPHFPNATSVLFHPKFTPEGWDHLHHEQTVIKLLNVIPTGREASSLNTPADLADYVWKTIGDPFQPW